jgi:hypothetical protein
MRKAVTDGSKPIKGESRRRYWVHATPGTPRKSHAEGEPKRPAKARFLEPYHISEARRGELIELLAAAGVGDPESRDLFVAAIEYDIANLRRSSRAQTPAPAPVAVVEPQPVVAREHTPDSAPDTSTTTVPPAAPGPDPKPEEGRRPEALDGAPGPLLERIAASARELASQLEALEPEPLGRVAAALQDADPFRRVHTADYFRALEQELARLALAISGIPGPAGPIEGPDPGSPAVAQAPAPAPNPTPEPRIPALDRASRGFLDRVARVYEEVLEAPAEIDPARPFAPLLRLVAGEAGISLPADPGALAAAWRSPQGAS